MTNFQPMYARDAAMIAHCDQFRADGVTPYVEHLRQVAQLVWSWGGTPEQVAAAWLHDIIEDTGYGSTAFPNVVDALRFDGISEPVIEMVELLTRPPAERYQGYIKRIVESNSPAILVKFADLVSNLSTPMPKGMENTLHRRYALALATLGPYVYAASWKDPA